MNKNLSVVLIAHNEEQNIGRIIEALEASYQKEILEIVAVDDNSTDGTAGVVEGMIKRYGNVRLIKRSPPPGVGRALKAGFAAVDPRCEYILSMDSDFIYNIPQVSKLIEEAGKGCDGVIGSRYTKGGHLKYYPFAKRMANRIFHAIAGLIFNTKCKDLSNNFKLYRKEIFQKLPYYSDDFAMNAETGILPIIYGYRIKEVPVSWIGRKEDMGISKFKIWRCGPGYAKALMNAVRIKNSLKRP
jgi:glycosyltransferase involved in cell wall biosynthesis